MYLYTADICARVSAGVTLYCKKNTVYFESFVIFQFFKFTSSTVTRAPLVGKHCSKQIPGQHLKVGSDRLLPYPLKFIISWPSSYLTRVGDIDGVSK
jgi:hypothetical protein